MIVATRPDPTVRPPSRYLNTVFLHIFYAFGWQNPHKTAVFAYCIFICLSSWHRFGTVGTSSSFTTINWNLQSYSYNFPLFKRLSSPFTCEMICIFPYFCPYAEIAREIRENFSLGIARHFVQNPCGSLFSLSG